MTQLHEKHRRPIPWRKVALILLCTYLSVTVFLMFEDYFDAQSRGMLIPRHHMWDILRPIATSTSSAPNFPVQDLSSWMTFSYINRLYNLPPDYLAAKLPVADKRYPRLSVARYAADTKQSEAMVMAIVQDAVKKVQSLLRH